MAAKTKKTATPKASESKETKATAPEKTVKLETPRGQRVYKGLKTEAAKPTAERAMVLHTRNGDAKPRRYHMPDAEARNLRAAFASTKVFQAPYREKGKYNSGIQALANLGVNEYHSLAAVKGEMKKIMKKQTASNGQNCWEAFENPPKATEKSKDLNGRLIQNFEVLQRLNGQHPYGWKLAQLWACIDITEDARGVPMFRLNTQFNSIEEVAPINTTKVRAKKAAAKATEAAAAPKTSKPAKPKAKAKAKPKAKAKAKPKAKAKAKPASKAKKDPKVDPKLSTVTPVAPAQPAGSVSD